jgi:hypothetical protein
MTAAVGGLNIVLGLVYTQYGSMTLVEMLRNRRAMGFSHFGAAWIAMAFTCGPHHWIHGIHIVAEGRAAGPLDLAAVLIGFPAGVIWFLLRVEAFRGGSGDRLWTGNPLWVLALPTMAGIYVTAFAAAAIQSGGFDLGRVAVALPNLLLIGIYLGIGWFLAQTQVANRRPLGGWSVSGLALAIIFPTCAGMHAIYALYTLNGRYAVDIHGLTADLVAVPAGLYFLWVVRALYRGTFADWNGSPLRERSAATEAAVAAMRA